MSDKRINLPEHKGSYNTGRDIDFFHMNTVFKKITVITQQ